MEDVQGYSDYALRAQLEEEEKKHHQHKHHIANCKKDEPAVFGQAHVTHMYEVTEKPEHHHTSHHQPKKTLQVAGVWINKGELLKRLKFRVIRNGVVIQDELKAHSFKNLKDDITHAVKGMEAGITFENFNHYPFKLNDVIQCYQDKPLKGEGASFSLKPGVYESY